MKIRHSVVSLAVLLLLTAAKCTQDGPGKPDRKPGPGPVWVDPSATALRLEDGTPTDARAELTCRRMAVPNRGLST